MFRHLLSPRSFNSLEGLLVHKQVSFLITFDGVRFILIATIALVIYLVSWAFIDLIISVKFMVDQHPLFLQTLHY
jgi:hypothetical protein